jgi:hypothetical protein
MPVQLASPSGVANPRGTSCDVLDNVRLGRPQGLRLAMLTSWPGMALSTHGETEGSLAGV